MKFFTLIKRLDILVKPFQFNVLKLLQVCQSYIVGGIFSILLFFTYALYAISLYNRQTLGQNSIYAGSQSDSQMNFGLDQTVVKFALELSSLSGITFSNYTEIAKRKQEIIGFQRNQTQLQMKKCNKTYLDDFNFDSASITEQQKQQLLCFDGQFSINGQFYDPTFQYIKIQITLCDASENKDCKSIEEIQDFIEQGVNVDLFIKGSKIKKQLNITSPAISFPKNIFWRTTTGIANNEDIFIAPIQIERRQQSIKFESGALMCCFLYQSLC